MRNNILEFTFSFTGNDSNASEIDLYDVSQALIGFQRSVALTTHLVLNDEIITQSPSLKGAKIYALPPETGSWKLTAAIVLTGAYNVATAPNNTPLGHLVYSLYDYVICESLGFHVDYNKSLGELYEKKEGEKSKIPLIKQHKADSLIEKCSTAIKEMHRPIYKTETATSASIIANLSGRTLPINAKLSINSYEFINETFTSNDPVTLEGRISSYNSNTYKGRVYINEIGRPISFELTENVRHESVIRIITASLSANALKMYTDESSIVHFTAFKNESKAGHLKSLNIIDVQTN